MASDRAKADDKIDHRIDPALKKDESASSKPAQPVNPAGAQRRENESAVSRDNDGQRKRAEEGL